MKNIFFKFFLLFGVFSSIAFGGSSITFPSGTVGVIPIKGSICADAIYIDAGGNLIMQGEYGTCIKPSGNGLITYRVSYNDNNKTSGTIPAEQEKLQDVNLTLATNSGTLAKTHHSFGGWNSLASGLGTSYLEGAIYSFDESLTLFANWVKDIYTVTFESNGGIATIVNQLIPYNSFVIPPTTPTKTGYTFDRWFSNSDLNISFDFASGIDHNTTLFGKWNINKFSVIFESNGGSVVTTQIVDYNGTVNQTSITPTKTGYTFDGWYSDSGLTSIYDFATQITANKTLYAKWNINSYSVSFEPNNGITIGNQTIQYLSTASIPSQPTKTEHTFGGWFSDSGFTSSFNFGTGIDHNTTLYAKWNINKYSVRFESNGGSGVLTQTIDYNGTAVTPANPTKVKYTFDGWYSDSNLSTSFSFANKITKNTILYAKWNLTGANQFIVTFNSNGGSAIASQMVTTTATTPTAPTKDGYTFGGWYSDSGLTNIFSFGTTISTDIILYAKWTLNTPAQTTGVCPSGMYGAGTAGDMCQVTTATQLQAINTSATTLGYSYKLMNNINLSGVTWTPIGGAANPFIGTFDGQSYTISNLSISSSANEQGLFSAVQNATIKNLTIANASITTAGAQSGILIGKIYGSSSTNTTLTNITISGGSVTGGGTYIGSIVGYMLFQKLQQAISLQMQLYKE